MTNPRTMTERLSATPQEQAAPSLERRQELARQLADLTASHEAENAPLRAAERETAQQYEVVRDECERALKAARIAHGEAHTAVTRAGNTYTHRRALLEGELRRSAPRAIADLRALCTKRLDEGGRDSRRPVDARVAQIDVIKAALAELSSLELEPLTAEEVERRLADLARAIE